jgi:hypothetical protein
VPYPDFLCIGANKCGTTWFHWNLKRHNQISLPYIKEINYFDNQADSIPNGFIGRLFSSKAGTWKRQLKKQLYISNNYKDIKRMKWMIRYFFGFRSDKWYSSLFCPTNDQISGEVTPSYYCLDYEHVERIHKLMPDCKIIFLMRNPVEQIWSMVKFVSFKVLNNKFNDVPHIELKKLCDCSDRLRKSDYLMHLSNWENLFPKENILIGFYDEIKDCPEEFLRKTFDFLGVEHTQDNAYAVAQKVINSGPKLIIPDDIRVILAQKTYGILQRLHGRFGGYATKWLEEETEFLRKHSALSEDESPSSLRSAKYCCTA